MSKMGARNGRSQSKMPDDIIVAMNILSKTMTKKNITRRKRNLLNSAVRFLRSAVGT